MGLTNCPECGKEISDMAASCPNCGRPMRVQGGPQNVNAGQPYVNQEQQNMGQQVMYQQMQGQTPQANGKKKGSCGGCLASVFAAFFVLAVIGGIVGGVTSKNTGATNTAKETENSVEETASEEESKAKAKLEVLSYDSVSEKYTRYVVGEIKNNTDKSYSYVQVSINLYNDDVLVGSTLANVNNLGPGEVWSFKAPILYDNCNKFKIEEVTGF